MAKGLEIISIVLIVLTALSFLPLYRGLYVIRSVNGISVTAILILALCAQGQLVTLYYLWACPTYKRDGNVVPKPPLSIDWINLVQLIVQWICSLLLLSFVLMVRTSAQNAPTTATPMTSLETYSPSTKTAVTVLTIHASLSLFWAWFAGTPIDDWLDLSFVTIMGVQQYIFNYFITIGTGIAFGLQAYTTMETKGPSALNKTGILLQAVIFLALSVSWLFRFKVPRNLWTQSDIWFLECWYPLVGWTCVNNAVYGLGQLLVFYCATWGRAGGGGEVDGERQALLSPSL